MRSRVGDTVFQSVVLLAAVILIPLSGLSLQTTQGDPQARIVLSQSVAAMGGAVPGSSLAVGTIDLVEGSLEERGQIRILTRGASESREEIHTPRGLRGRVYSQGLAARLSDFGIETTSLELAASSQSLNFPLVLLAGALSNPDFAFQYVGQETLAGITTHHIRFWNTYTSNPRLAHLAEFSIKDLWLDASTLLPRKLAYEEREGGGSAPRIAVGAIYSDYRDVGGVLYPFRSERIYNGTPWATITIDTVTINTSVSDAAFATR